MKNKKNRSIYVSEEFYQLIYELADRENRSMAGQLEYLSKIGITFEQQLTKQEIFEALDKYNNSKKNH
jgi:hypothetical protein